MKKKLLAVVTSAALVLSLSFGNVFGTDTKCCDEPQNGLVSSKTVTYNNDGSYNINIEAYANSKISTQEKHIANDIVLVLDKSGSMAFDSPTFVKTGDISGSKKNSEWLDIIDNLYFLPDGKDQYIKINIDKFGRYYNYKLGKDYVDNPFGDETSVDLLQLIIDNTDYKTGGSIITGKYLSRMEVLQDTAKGFVEQVRQDAIKNKVDHRVAIVGFSDTDKSAIYDGKTTYNGNSYSDADNTFNSCLKSVREDKYYNDCKDSIDSLTPAGATDSETGMKLAEKILEKRKNESTKKTVIYISDGVPTKDPKTLEDWYYNSGTRFQYDVANGAIQMGEHLKQYCNIYTIGIFKGADPSSCEDNRKCNTQLKKVNRFMNLLSSNYPKATNMDNNGTSGITSGYYLTAQTELELDNIFKTIKEQIVVSESTLGKEAEVRDVVSQYFKLPDGVKTSDIKVSTVDCTGKKNNVFTFDDSNPKALSDATIAIDNDTVKVSGFDFGENCCSYVNKKPQGKKLLISFKIVPKPEFLGGNNVPTNDYVLKDGKVTDCGKSGIYESKDTDKSIAKFDSPIANVPINAHILTKDANIYAGNACPDLISLVTNLPSEKSWEDDYVKMVFSKGTDKFDCLHDNKDYEFYVSVEPTVEKKDACDVGIKQDKNNVSAKCNINVFTPVIPCKDNTIKLGEKAPEYLGTDIFNDNTQVLWKHVDTLSTDSGVVMTGEVPTLVYDYDIKPDYFEHKTPIHVTSVKNGEAELETVAQFTNPDVEPEGKEFTVYVINNTLTVTKKGIDPVYGGDKQSFVMHIKGSGNEIANKVDITIVLTSDEPTKTVTGLPYGKYTVTEEKGWSWRYNADTKTISLSKDNEDGKLTINNTVDEKKWFDGNSNASNRFSSVAKEATND